MILKASTGGFELRIVVYFTVTIVEHFVNHLSAYLLSFFDPARPMWAQLAPSRQVVVSYSFLLWAFLPVLRKITQKLTTLPFRFSIFLSGATN